MKFKKFFFGMLSADIRTGAISVDWGNCSENAGAGSVSVVGVDDCWVCQI